MNQTGHEEFAERPYGWVIVAVATLALALAFGANITVTVFMTPFQREFGWSRAEISMAYSVLTVGIATGGVAWGSLFDKIGAKGIGLFGAAVMSFGLMALRWQSELWAIYALYFLIGACGFACLFTPMLALTGLWFSRRKGLALGLVTAGGALGQGLVPFIVRLLITETGWRDAALWLGISYFVLLVPAILLVRTPPVLVRSGETPRSTDGNLWNLPHTLSIPWLALAGIFCCICMAVPLMHLVPLGIDLRLSPQTAAGLLLALMTAGIFGRLFFGWLADRIGGLLAYFCASFVQTAMVFWFTQTGNLALLYIISVLFGFGFAGVMTGLIICAREAAPLRLSGFALAVVTTSAWIGMGIGSYQGGYFHDLTQSYVLSFGNAAIAGLFNLVIVAGLIWYRQRVAPAGRWA